MPDVGLTTSSKPLDPKYRVVIKYSVEVEGLPVYNESYDVDTLRKELKNDANETLKRWSLRLLAAAYCRDKEGFSACLTRGLVDGQGCACGHKECCDLLSSVHRDIS